MHWIVRSRVAFAGLLAFSSLAAGCKSTTSDAHHINERFFKSRVHKCGSIPRFIAEGDSWFHYPDLWQGLWGTPQDILSHIRNAKSREPLCRNKRRKVALLAFSTFGDELGGMMLQRETRKWLLSRRKSGIAAQNRYTFDALLLSAGGNDLLHSQTFSDLVRDAPRPFPANPRIEDLIDARLLEHLIAQLRKQIETFAYLVQKQSRNKNIFILIHGYDYLRITRGKRKCRSFWAAFACEWIRPVLKGKGYGADRNKTRNRIVRHLIDRYNRELADIAKISGRDGLAKVVYVDVRGTITSLDGWQDEIHPTSKAACHLANKLLVAYNRHQLDVKRRLSSLRCK